MVDNGLILYQNKKQNPLSAKKADNGFFFEEIYLITSDPANFYLRRCI